MKSLLVLAAATLALSACGSSNNDNKGGGNAHETATPQTTASDCIGTRLGSGTGLEGSWYSDFASQSKSFRMQFTFSSGYVTLSNTCQQGGVARVSVPYSDSGSSFTVLRADSDDSTSASGETCSVSISKASVRYRFQGSCLVLSDAGSQSEMFLKSTY